MATFIDIYVIDAGITGRENTVISIWITVFFVFFLCSKKLILHCDNNSVFLCTLEHGTAVTSRTAGLGAIL